MRCQVDIQTARRYFRAAVSAPAIFTLIKTLQRGLYFRPLQLAAARGLFRHLLALKRVHPVEAANTLLIQHHSPAFIAQLGVHLVKLRSAADQCGFSVID